MYASKVLSLLFFSFFFAQANHAQTCDDISGFTKLGDFEGHGYYLSNQNLNWKDANHLTLLKGGYLATINTQAENDFIKEHLGGRMVFIGLNDENQEGMARWTNGEPVTLDLSSGNTGDADFAVMNFWDGHWAFGNKWEERPFIMEVNCDGSWVPPVDFGPVQVFIFAGQSNMTGGGVTNELNPALRVLPANVRFSDLANWTVYTDFETAGNFGPEVGFVHEIAQAHPDKKYLIIKYGYGGSGMRDWLPGVWHYNTLMNHINGSLANLDEDYELAGLVWMQGETDAFSPQEAGLYESRLTSFVQGLRNQLGAPDLPVMIGQVDPPAACCTATVNAAEVNFVDNDAHAAYVPTGGVARWWYNQIHYNTAGQLDLGRRFYAGYQSIMPQGFALQCPENKDVNLEDTQTNIAVSWELASVTSDCAQGDEVIFTQVEGLPSGSLFDVGIHEIAYLATDNCGQEDSCRFTITVHDFNPCPSELAGYEYLGEFENQVYFLSENKLTWEAAHSAVAGNGHLADIQSQDENDFLKSTLGDKMVFIGFNDAESEGQPAWSSGTSVSLDLSYQNSDQNDYAVMDFWAGTWQMVNKWVEKRFVLERSCTGAFMGFRQNDESLSDSMHPEIFPNPAHSFIQVSIQSDVAQDLSLEIFSIYGQRFLAEKRTVPAGTSIQELDVMKLPKGVYFVRTPSGQVARFVKE